jgi:PPOX class probable F420-dependent enzyme
VGYQEMSEDEWRAFLQSPVRTAKVATVRKDGRPHVAPVWYDLDDDGTIVFTTGATTAKGYALRRDPRLSLCVDDEQPPFAFVMVEGVADLSGDLDAVLHWATRIGGRYMGDDQAESYGRRNAVEGELLVRVKPMAVVAKKDVAL